MMASHKAPGQERGRPETPHGDRQFRSLIEGMDKPFCVIARDQSGQLRYTLANRAYLRQAGSEDVVGLAVTDVAPGLDPGILAAFGEIVATGQSRHLECRHADGAIWMEVEMFPAGRPGEVALLFSNITRRKRAEAALRASEQRLETLVQGVPQLVWRAVEGGNWTWASSQWTEFTGQAEADSHGYGWLEPVHPDDREEVRRSWALAERRDAFDTSFRLYHVGDRRYRWVQTRASPVHDAESGRIVEWLGTSTDVDDLRRLQEQQLLLVAEMQHRVRNILTVVRSVFSRTIEADGTLEEISDHFKGRLDALARTQVIVTQSARGLVDLEDLVRDELLSVGVADGPAVRISGPDVALTSRVATSVGLALHELTTNSLKYGALRSAAGSLEITWRLDLDYGEARRLVFTWVEQGVPAVPVRPSRRGYGTELIEEALPYRLGAETRIEYRGGGIRCTIAMPLPDEAPELAETWRMH